MSEDREILRELWNGQVPVHFVLSSEEITTVETPQPYFVCILINGLLEPTASDEWLLTLV